MKGDGKGEPPYYKDSLTTDVVMRVEVCVDSSSASSGVVCTSIIVRWSSGLSSTAVSLTNPAKYSQKYQPTHKSLQEVQCAAMRSWKRQQG